MSIGTIFMIGAAAIFLLLTVGAGLFPRADYFGFFLLTLGILLDGTRISLKQ